MLRTRLPLRGRFAPLLRLWPGLALAALALTIGGSTVASAQQSDPALQGRLFQTSDGVVYVYKDGAKYLVNLASLDDDGINAIPDGQPVDRVDALFQQAPASAAVPTAGPAPATPAFDLHKALISLSDVPAGWKLINPTPLGGPICGITTGCIGGITACKGVVPPADGADDKAIVALGPSNFNLFDGGEVANDVVRFFPGAAKIYADAFMSDIQNCPSYNAVTTLWDGPALGDQTIRFATTTITTASAGVVVRIGDVVTEVSTQVTPVHPIDKQLLEHAAERATAVLQSAMQ